MLKNALMVVSMATAVFIGIIAPASAMISEPEVVYYGTAQSAVSGDSVTMVLEGETSPVASATLGVDLSYVLRIPMDALGARLPGTARTGDAAVIFIADVAVANIVIPTRGTLVALEIVNRTAEQWALDHPGDDGSGDINKNGISDLDEYLAGQDPAGCVWAQVDAEHVETSVYHPLVLNNCLAEAGNDLKHNLIRVTSGSYVGNFSYMALSGEDFDLTLIGGYDPVDLSKRSADPTLTQLNGGSNGTTLVVDTSNGMTLGKVHIENITLTGGTATNGQSGGGLQAHIFQGDLELIANSISGNTGGGLFIDSSDSGAILLVNNLLVANNATTAAAAQIVTAATGSVTLLNNTLADNTASQDGDGRSLLIEGTPLRVDMTNNIILGVSGSLGSDISINSFGVSIPLTVTHNAFDLVNGLHFNSPDFVLDATNLGNDPLFAEPLAGNYRLGTSSPCIDQGILHEQLPAIDADGVLRIVGSAVDMGAYEFQKVVAEITLSNLFHYYDGGAKTAIAITIPPGLNITYTYDGAGLSPINVGSYAVMATINELNFQGTASGTLVIDAAETLTYSVTPGAGTGGTISPATTQVVNSGDSISFTATASAGYALDTVTGCGGSLSGNSYTITEINADCSVTASFIISDPTPPVLTLSTLTDGAVTSSADLTLAGLVTGETTLGTLTINGVSATIQPDGSFSHLLKLKEGANTLIVVATDILSNRTTDIRNIILDSTAPTLSINTPADTGTTATALQIISGTCGDATSVSIQVGSSSPLLAAVSAGSFTLNVTLVEGLNTLTLTATDALGNRSSAVRTLTLDQTAPAVAFFTPATDLSIYSSTFYVSGTFSATDTSLLILTINGAPISAMYGNGIFSLNLDLPAPGSYALVATATDALGNTSRAIRHINYQVDPTGDLNQDQTVDASDALMVLRVAIGMEPLQPQYLLLGDVAPFINGRPQPDGKLTAADALVLLRRAVGLVNW